MLNSKETQWLLRHNRESIYLCLGSSLLSLFKMNTPNHSNTGTDSPFSYVLVHGYINYPLICNRFSDLKQCTLSQSFYGLRVQVELLRGPKRSST